MNLVPKVTILPVVTRLDLDAERILNHALERPLKGCVVIGEDEEGNLHFGASWADGGTVLWWMEKAKLALMGVA